MRETRTKNYTVSNHPSIQLLGAIAATLGLVATSPTSAAEQDSLSELCGVSHRGTK